MTLKEQCASCKANWDGHCINGNDTWKSINSCNEVICEDYEKEKKNHEINSCFYRL